MYAAAAAATVAAAQLVGGERTYRWIHLFYTRTSGIIMTTKSIMTSESMVVESLRAHTDTHNAVVHILCDV